MKLLEIANVDFALGQFVAPLMRAARARGHEVIGACADGPAADALRAEGFRVVALPFQRRLSPLAHVRSFFALLRLMRAERPDIVHAHFPISALLARAAARLAGVPCIAFTCHGFLFNQRGHALRRAVSFLAEWLSGRWTDVYMTVSEEEARDARRLGISARAIAIGNGRDPALFRPDAARRTRLREVLGLRPGRTVLVIVARLVRHKGFPELLAAMRDLAGAELWVIGSRLPSDRGPDVAAMLDAAGLGDRLRVFGHRDDVAELLAAADIFVLPSHFEGLPMSIVEAMLCGLPVVSTQVRGPREMVLNGQTGLLVPPGDVTALTAALRKLIEDPMLRRRMGAAGRARAVERYDEAVVIERTLRLLELA